MGRLTPARYRFSASAADSAYHASTNNGSCLEITPAVRCRTSLALMHKRPMGCRDVLSRQGKNVHLIPRHSPRTCRIPPECCYLLVQGAASLQRFAPGSDAAASQRRSVAAYRQCATRSPGTSTFTAPLAATVGTGERRCFSLLRSNHPSNEHFRAGAVVPPINLSAS